MENYLAVLVIGFALAVGLIVIGILMFMRNKQEKPGPGVDPALSSPFDDERRERLPNPLGEPASAPPASQPPVAQPYQAVGGPGLTEVARLLRNTQTGEFAVQVDGYIYHNAGQLSGTQHHLLAIGAGMLYQWLGMPAPAGAPVQPPAPAYPAAGAPSMGTPPAAPAGPALAGLKPGPTVQPVKPKPLEALSRAAGKPAPVTTFKSIPEQIDEILQQRLRGTPLEGQGIMLLLDPVEGAVVRVGDHRYPGVDAVPDEAVRSAIKAAVAEWERRQK